MKLEIWDSGEVTGQAFPEVRGWSVHPLEGNREGYTRVAYSLSSDHFEESGVVAVEFEVGGPEQSRTVSIMDRYRGATGDRGSRPATFEIEGFNDSVAGKWSDVREIPKILAKARAWGKQKMAKLKANVDRLFGRNWDYDWVLGGIAARYTGLKGPEVMSVDFEDPSSALSGGEEGRATIFFAMDQDPGGWSGDKEVVRSYVSLKDMAKILKEAEALFMKMGR